MKLISMSILGTSLLAATMLAQQAEVPVRSESVEQAARALHEQLFKALDAGDVTAVQSMFADRANPHFVVLPDGTAKTLRSVSDVSEWVGEWSAAAAGGATRIDQAGLLAKADGVVVAIAEAEAPSADGSGAPRLLRVTSVLRRAEPEADAVQDEIRLRIGHLHVSSNEAASQ